MSDHETSSFDDVAESLKRAVASLEEAAARERQRRASAAGAPSAADQADQLAIALRVVGDLVGQAARQRPDVQSALRQLGQWLVEMADPPQAQASVVVSPPQSGPSLAPPAAAVSQPAPSPAHEVQLRIGGANMTLQVPGTQQEVQAARQAADRKAMESGTVAAEFAPAVADVATIAARVRLKAEGCRWAVTRRRLVEEGADHQTAIKPTDESIIARARLLPQCYVWALDPNIKVDLPADEVLQDLAAGYDNVAAALEVAAGVQADPHRDHGLLSESYALLAEAQSALRIGMHESYLGRDQDQFDVFAWLRERTSEDRVLVQRHMKLDDPADPTAWASLARRIAELRVNIDDLKGLEKERKQLFNRCKYHAGRLGDASAEEARPDWITLVHSLDELVRLGVPPSDTAIRDLLAPVVDSMPDDLELPASFDHIMQSLDQFLMSRELGAPAAVRPRTPSPEVIEAAALLRDRAVVLIGGQCRVQSQLALQRELHLSEVNWISTTHRQSHFDFEPAISRADTALVILAIRWSAHSFENAKTLCEKYGKPFVRLPGGYSPNQVARQILDQVGEQLRRAYGAGKIGIGK